jgi:hypothetical protein
MTAATLGPVIKASKITVDEYAPHLWNLLRDVDSWARRRVVSCTVIDGDTMRICVSLDFDLRASKAGIEYLSELQGRPALIPIGLYLEPYVGFDLRDSGDTRVSLIPQSARKDIFEKIKELERSKEGESDLLAMLSGKGLSLAIAELPSQGCCSAGRCVLHFSYLGRWLKDQRAFPFLPQNSVGPDLKFWSKDWWRRQKMLLGWYPMRVVMPLWNARFSESLHVELHTPEEIRINEAGIWAENGGGQTEMWSKEDPPKRDVPPNRDYSIVRYRAMRDEQPEQAGKLLAFRAWLSLERKNMWVILFLAIFNSLVSAGAVASFPFARLNIEAVVSMQLLAAAAAFAYLYVPGEHGLCRGLYSAVRYVFVTIAALGLVVAGALVLLEPHWQHINSNFPALGIYDSIFSWIAMLAAVFMVLLTFVLFISWLRVKESRVKRWLDRNVGRRYDQFGWHVVG